MEGANVARGIPRHIDARYDTPHPAVDWLAGTVERQSRQMHS